MCSDDSSSSPDACYSVSSKGYFREWRLWSDVAITEDWPEVFSTSDQSVRNNSNTNNLFPSFCIHSL